MKLTIHTQRGDIRTVIEPSDNSAHQFGIMVDNVLSLSFVLPEFVRLEVNDYIIFRGWRYDLLDPYQPEKESSIEYKYNVKFFDIWGRARGAIVRKGYGDNDDELSFSLTGSLALHAQLMVDNLNRISGTRDWVIGEVAASGNITVDYDNVKVAAACADIAEKAGTEFWSEGTTLNFSRCEHGTMIELGYMQGLQNLSRSSNENAPFFTRLYPIGTTRNIVKDKYGYSRLRLPGGALYVEQNTHLGIVEHSEEAAFSHIYPRRVGRVSAVRSEEVNDPEGKPFTIYYFKDGALPFDPNDYEVPGLVKGLLFVSGQLNGYEFEVNFNSEIQEFEIITQYPEGVDQLPGGFMVPNVGDEYALYNIYMPDEYVTAAEQELKAAVDEYLAKYAIDVSVYKAKTDYTWFLEYGIDLNLGRRVRLYSDEYFEGGYRDSRVISISQSLNNPYEMEIEFSYAVKVGRIARLEYDVNSIRAAFREQLNRDVLTVLKSWDSIDPSEYNVFSALRSRMEHLSRLYPDTARGFINFLKGIAVGEDASFAGAISSPEFISGFLDGTGWSVRWVEEENAAGVKEKKAVAEFDDVTVRRSLRVHTLVVNQTRAENGNIVFSDGMKIDHVDVKAGRIYLDTDGGTLYNPFHPDDCVMSQRFSGMPSEDNGYLATKQYEMVITDVGIGEDGENRLDWISFRGFVGNLSAIEKGDVIVRVDNLTDPARKGIVMMVTNGVDAPYIDAVYGLKTDPEGAVKSRSGNLAGIIHPYFGQLHGFGHYAQNFYGVGSFQFRSGRQIETAVEIAEGLSRTTMQKTMYALTEETNYLKNGTFTEEMMYWDCENSVSPVTVGGQLLMHNRSLSTIKVRVATMTEYGGRNMLRLKDSYVRQANEHIRKPEPYEEEVTTIDEETGEEVTETKRRLPKLYLSFRMICREAGTLTVGFKGAGKATGEEDEGQEPMPFTVQGIGAGNEAEPVTYTFEGTWDGEGDFLLSFTGDAYIDQLAITGKPLEEFKVQVSTKFEQTAERITMEGKRIDEANKAIGVVGLELNALDTSLTLYAQRTDNLENTVGSVGIRLDGMENSLTLHAGRIDNLNSTIGSVSLRLDGVDSSLSVTASRVNRIDGDVAGLTGKVNQILSAGYITRPEGNLMWASKEYENGAKIISTINQTAEEVYIKADKIKLEGVVTANNYFRINLDGSIDVNVGRIGGFEIAYGRIGAVASANGTPAFGSLAIYDDFFRVGGANGYVMFGDDVIPAVAGGAFTAVGRIVNKAPNTGAQWGFSTANYGLFIDVTGGTTNYGIQSNAPLMAPAFINTRLKRVTFGTGSYSLDFSQAFIFLAYASTAVNIILPDEAAIRRMFNVSSLPSDFGYYFIITADHGTRRFTLTDVYNHDGNLHNWDFEQGDTAIVLIKKYPTFRYQMLSYRYNQ